MATVADRILAVVARLATGLSMAGLALLVILFSASIVTRFLDVQIPAVDDLASILLAAVFAFGLAAAVGANEHLSITLFVDKLPPKSRWLLLRVTEAITIAVSVYLFLGVYHLFAAALRSNQMMLGALPIPRYLPIGLVAAGVALFAIALTCAFVRNVLRRPTDTAPEH